MFSKALESAQKRVEENNYGIRKHLLEYDQVMNEQRETIYAERRRVLKGEDLKNSLMRQVDDLIAAEVNNATAGTKFPEEWNMEVLNQEIRGIIPLKDKISVEGEENSITDKDLTERIQKQAHDLYTEKEEEVGEDKMREVERMILLRTVDTLWTEHLDIMDQMRQGIGLQAFAQKNPLDEYRLIGYDMFEELNENIIRTTLRGLYTVHLVQNEEVERKEVGKNISTNRGSDQTAAKKPVKRSEKKVGRNDPCPCGSGKKYKNCCGRFEQ